MTTLIGAIVTILFALFLFCLMVILPLATIGLISMSLLGTIMSALKGR